MQSDRFLAPATADLGQGEMTIFSEQYDFAITLLLLKNPDRYIQIEPDSVGDTYDRLVTGRA
jgi:hypothetical protein